jgi:AraC-like DNA-binding protein
MTYWIDEKRGNVFCLIEAPSKEAVSEMHERAHGLVPHKIIEVNDTLVESFLGRISDPEEVQHADGLKIFEDSSFRTLLVIRTQDNVLLQNELGEKKANEIIQDQNKIIRNELAAFEGSEVEHGGDGIIASFSFAGKAVSCALSIREKFRDHQIKLSSLRFGIHAGDPIVKAENLFGDTIQLAERLCSVAKGSQVAISVTVREIVPKDILQKEKKNILTLSPHDEELLSCIYNVMEKKALDPEFTATDFAQEMVMSKSQLYRKILSLTGHAPNSLIKEFRLEKAREFMKKKPYSIGQITYDAGFASPSYFTKCFKKKFGMLPMSYFDMYMVH